MSVNSEFRNASAIILQYQILDEQAHNINTSVENDCNI